MDQPTTSGYCTALDQENAQLDASLLTLGTRYTAGTLTVREAADERIRLLTNHLTTLQELRDRFLGGE